MSEQIKSYLDLREEAEYLTRLLLGARFPPLHHNQAIEAALAASLGPRGMQAFDPPYWYVCTTDFQRYQVSERADGRVHARLDQFASFREVQLWKYSIARAKGESGTLLSPTEAYAAPGFLP